MPSIIHHCLNSTRTRLLAAAIFATFTAGCEKAAQSGRVSKPFEGYTLVEQLMSNTTDLIDMEGRVVHRWRSKYGHGGGARLLPNGDLIRCGVLQSGPFVGITFGLAGVVERFDWDGNLLWSFVYSEPRKTSHHDVEVLPNGNLLLAAIEIKDKDEQLQAGRDPARMRQKDLWSDFLMEIKPTGNSGGEIVWEWHIWDHLVQDHDPKRNNHGVVSENPGLIDVNFIEAQVPITASTMKLLQSVGYVGGQKGPAPSGPGAPDWTHVNSLSYNPELDQILLTVRSLGEIWVIDHSTTTAEAAGHSGGKSGRGGDLLYRWGNPQAYQRGKPSDQKLFGPHDGQWIPPGRPGAGNVLVFNNGDGRRDADYSSIEEIRLPGRVGGESQKTDGAAFGPDAPVWSYVAEPRNAFFSSFLSGVQRLPNGHTLICSGVQREVFEVDQAGRTVWRYKATAPVDSAKPPGGPGPGSPSPAGPPGPPQPPSGPGGDAPPLPPLVSILDGNKDGVIDADELAQATALLKSLDKNADGRVTLDECLPAPSGPPGGPPMPSGPGGPTGGPGPGGPGGPGPGGPGGPSPGGPGGRGMPPLPPIFTTLDANGDKVFDSAELAEATNNLLKIDANKDGRISMDEGLPRGRGGPGGPGGPPPGTPGGPGAGPGGPPPIPPIITVFSPGQDGTIGADAIARAPEILKKLDRDGDGALAITECLPQFPGTTPGAASGGSAPGREGAPPFLPPILSTLDSNGDLKIDAQEIAGATAALLKLDKNGDGRLSIDESVGRPPGRGGPGGGVGPDFSANIGGLFRARRFAPDYPAFTGRKLAPIEDARAGNDK